MFSWVDRHLFQVIGRLDMQFGEILIILIGSFAHLSPVTDEPLYYLIPSGNTAITRYLEYKRMTTVIKLIKNQRVFSTDHQRFRDFLIRLRHGNNMLEN